MLVYELGAACVFNSHYPLKYTFRKRKMKFITIAFTSHYPSKSSFGKRKMMFITIHISHCRYWVSKANGFRNALHIWVPRYPYQARYKTSTVGRIWRGYRVVSTAAFKSMSTEGKDVSLPGKALRLVAPRCIALDSLIGKRGSYFLESVIIIQVILSWYLDFLTEFSLSEKHVP